MLPILESDAAIPRPDRVAKLSSALPQLTQMRLRAAVQVSDPGMGRRRGGRRQGLQLLEPPGEWNTGLNALLARRRRPHCHVRGSECVRLRGRPGVCGRKIGRDHAMTMRRDGNMTAQMTVYFNGRPVRTREARPISWLRELLRDRRLLRMQPEVADGFLPAEDPAWQPSIPDLIVRCIRYCLCPLCLRKIRNYPGPKPDRRAPTPVRCRDCNVWVRWVPASSRSPRGARPPC